MSRPLNEYPRHELEEMLRYINNCFYHETLDPIRKKWKERVKQAISDREFEDSKLPDERK